MSNLLACKLCGKSIKFDDKRVSERTGKKIPLDVDTDKPHDCPVWKGNQQYQQQPQAHQQQQQSQLVQHDQRQPSQKQQERRYQQCRKGCGQEIYFDASNKSQSGKYIPLSKDTGEPHQCQ